MQTGHTLIEVLAALAIAAVLAVIATPAWDAWIAGTRATATLNSFATVLAAARTTAVSFGTVVRVCPGQGNRCGERNRWHEGTLAFADLDADRVVDADERIIAVHPGFEGGELRWRSFRNRADLLFVPSGLTDWLNGNFLYCPHDGNPRQARMLIINIAGRIRHAPDRNGDGVREDARGRPVTC